MAKALLAGLLAAAAVLGGTRLAAAADAAGCRAPLGPWTEIDLYLGRDIAGDGIVTEAEFRRFLSEVVTPRFPDGLSVLDVAGQFRDSQGRIVREPSKLLVVLVPDASAAAGKVGRIIAAYKERFHQESVLHAGFCQRSRQ